MSTITITSAAQAALELFHTRQPHRYRLASRWARLVDAAHARTERVDRWVHAPPNLIMAVSDDNRVLAIALTPDSTTAPDWRDTYCVTVVR